MIIPFKTIGRCRAGSIAGCDITVRKYMPEYAGWGWLEHLEWIAELSGLCLEDLVLLVAQGWMVLTDESVSVVWVTPADNVDSMADLVYTEYAG